MPKIMWHSCAPWAPSGYGTQTAVWAQKLTEMGHEVIISSYWGLSGSSTTWNGITVLPGWGSNYCTSSLSGHFRSIQPDLVITLSDIWVLDPNLIKEMPVAHWLPSDCRPMSLADKGIVDHTGAQLIAMSHFGHDRFRSAGYNPLYVPHGINTEVFAPSPNREELREKAGIADNFVIGINAANNDAIRKAIPEQMLAFAKFLKTRPDAILALHSNVSESGGQDLEVLAENLGITDRIRVVDQYRYASGFVSPQDLADWYSMIDVLSACTYGEGFGLPIIEAQACGTPVITTEASSMTELNPLGISVKGKPFWNGVHKGWWISPFPGEIADAYDWHSRNAPDGEKLRRFAVDNYSADVVAQSHMGPAIDELLRRLRP